MCLLLQTGAQAGVLGSGMPSWLANWCNPQLRRRRVRAQRVTTTSVWNTESKGRSSDGRNLTLADFPPLAAPALTTSPSTTPPPQPTHPRTPQPQCLPWQPHQPPRYLPGTQTTPPRHHTHPSIWRTHVRPTTTDPTPTTPYPSQTVVAGPPADRSKPEAGGQPHTTRPDLAENPPERSTKPDAPVTEQAGGSLRGSADSQGACGKRQKPQCAAKRLAAVGAIYILYSIVGVMYILYIYI